MNNGGIYGGDRWWRGGKGGRVGFNFVFTAAFTSHTRQALAPSERMLLGYIATAALVELGRGGEST